MPGRRHINPPHSIEQAQEMLDVGATDPRKVIGQARVWARRRGGYNYDNTTLYSLIAMASATLVDQQGEGE